MSSSPKEADEMMVESTPTPSSSSSSSSSPALQPDNEQSKKKQGRTEDSVNADNADNVDNVDSTSTSAAERTPVSSPSPSKRSRLDEKDHKDDPNDDTEWLATIKKRVQAQVGEDWEEEELTPFFVEVARFLREKRVSDTHVVKSLVGLYNVGAFHKTILQSLAKNKDISFIDRLEQKGVGLGISALLFDKYCSEVDRRADTSHGSKTPSSPGSSAYPSRAALNSFIENAKATGFSIEWQGGDLDLETVVKEKYTALSSAEELLRQLRDNLNISSHEGPRPDDHELANLDFRILRKLQETPFQKGHLQQNFFAVDAAKAIDSSKSADGPYFLAPSTVYGGHTVSKFSGRPDATSVIVPMDLEIKSDTMDRDDLAKVDFQVLDQTLKRIVWRMNILGFLKTAFAFAITGRSAWYFYVERPKPLETPVLRMNRICHKDVGVLWMGITRLGEENPGFYLAKDGAAICNALNKIGVTPWRCRVKALATSQCAVYGVSIPGTYNDSRESTSWIDVRVEEIKYAVKIIHDNASYKTESEALHTIATEASKAGIDNFYALGCVPTGTGKATKFFQPHIPWETDTSNHREETIRTSTSTGWWTRIPSTKQGRGGAIIMRYGEETARDRFERHLPLPKNVVSDLVKSLQLAHSARVLHCDLRRTNFVRFGSEWQVIDYNLSTTVDSEHSYAMQPGAQADCAGLRVKRMYKMNESFHWTEADDYQMFIANILEADIPSP